MSNVTIDCFTGREFFKTIRTCPELRATGMELPPSGEGSQGEETWTCERSGGWMHRSSASYDRLDTGAICPLWSLVPRLWLTHWRRPADVGAPAGLSRLEDCVLHATLGPKTP